MGDIDISNIHYSKLTRADIEKQFAGDKRLDKILLIFDKINALDEEIGTELSAMDFAEMGHVKSGKWSNGEPKKAFLKNNYDEKITDWELSEYMKAAKEFYGEEIEEEDFRKFLGFAASKGDKAYSDKLKETSKETGLSEELIEKLGGVYMAKAFKTINKNGKQYLSREIDGYKELRDINGKLLETRETESTIIGYEGTEEISTYDENGESSRAYINHKTGEQTKFIYGKSPEDKSYKLHIKDGVAVKQSHTGVDDPNWKNMKLEDIVFTGENADSTKVSFKYDKNNQLVGIDIKDQNAENDVPRGFTRDGVTYLTHVPKKTSVTKEVVESIKQMIDGGARYGEDFDLKIVDGQLKVIPKIKNETGQETPELKGAAMDRYKDLVGKGIHAGEDFDVEYDENGNFRYNLKNNQAKEYDADYKSETFDKNGNLISSVTVKNGEVIRETMVNGEKQVSKMSFDEAFMQLVLEKDFAIAGEILGKDDVLSGGYNIYPSAEKYKQLTGRELIGDVYDALQNTKDKNSAQGMKNLLQKLQPHGYGGFDEDPKKALIQNYYDGYNSFKAVLEFNPKNSQIADLLPKIERIQKGENAFSETINNDTFDVNFNNSEITISKNGKPAKSINIKGFPENYIKNVLTKTPSSTLYDIASSGCEIKLNDSMNDNSHGSTTNGQYQVINAKGRITLDPNALIGDRAIQTLVHESGHMCDHIDNKENAIKTIKESLKDPTINFGRDKPFTVNELLEMQGTLQGVSPNDEKLKELFNKELENYRKNPPSINENAEYATTNIMEFFAESYTLLNFGTCKSEYVIANYFPETFKRVNELIEANRTYRENN